MDEVLNEIARGLGEVESLDDLLPYVLERATELFTADRALFAVTDPKGRIRRSIRHNLPEREDGSLPISSSLLEQVLQERQSVVIYNTHQSNDYQSHESVRLNNIQFMMGVPVMTRATLLGILYIDGTSNHYEGPDLDMQLLEGLAGLVSLVLRNLEAIEEQRYRADFTASVFHRARGSLQVARTSLDTLRPTVDRDGREVIATIFGSFDELGTLATSVLALHKLESTPQSPPVEIYPATELRQRARFFESFARTMTGEPLIVEAEGGVPMISTDASRFGTVIDELLLNAVKYSPIGRAVTVSISRHPEPSSPPALQERVTMHRIPQLRPKAGAPFVRICITNGNRDGPIAPERQAKLFEPFVRAASHWDSYSSGLGLSVVRELVESVGGRISLDSNPEETSFYVDLPARVEPVD